MTRCLSIMLTAFVSASFIIPPAAHAGSVYSIQDAYESALTRNENIKVVQEEVFQSDARIDQAWSNIYPRVVGQGAYTRYNQTLPPGGGAYLFQPLQSLQASVTLIQPLYTGGRTLAGLKTAEQLKETSITTLSASRQDLLLQVAGAYYTVLKAKKAVEISERSFARMEHHKTVTEQEAATRRSKANQSALLRANSLVSQARIALVRSRDGLAIAREKLALLTKLPRDMEVAEPTQLEAPAGSLESLQKLALENRDDYAKSRMDRKIAEENVTIVKGGHYPQVNAVAGVTYQTSEPATALDATVFYGGVQLEIPIFEGGLAKSQVSEAKSKVRQAELSTDYLRKSIESEVHEAYINLQTETSVLDTAKLQRDYAQGNYDAVEGLFSEGLLASLSLIDAEGALTSAEQGLANAGYDRQLAILTLKKVIGMLGKE